MHLAVVRAPLCLLGAVEEFNRPTIFCRLLSALFIGLIRIFGPSRTVRTWLNFFTLSLIAKFSGKGKLSAEARCLVETLSFFKGPSNVLNYKVDTFEGLGKTDVCGFSTPLIRSVL